MSPTVFHPRPPENLHHAEGFGKRGRNDYEGQDHDGQVGRGMGGASEEIQVWSAPVRGNP
jgi:hypothetical protein